MLKRIEVTDTIRELVEGTYGQATVDEVNIHKIIVDGNDVNIEVDLCIDGAWAVCNGNIQMGLDDDNSLAEALRKALMASLHLLKERRYDAMIMKELADKLQKVKENIGTKEITLSNPYGGKDYRVPIDEAIAVLEGIDGAPYLESIANEWEERVKETSQPEIWSTILFGYCKGDAEVERMLRDVIEDLLIDSIILSEPKPRE